MDKKPRKPMSETALLKLAEARKKALAVRLENKRVRDELKVPDEMALETETYEPAETEPEKEAPVVEKTEAVVEKVVEKPRAKKNRKILIVTGSSSDSDSDAVIIKTVTRKKKKKRVVESDDEEEEATYKLVDAPPASQPPPPPPRPPLNYFATRSFRRR